MNEPAMVALSYKMSATESNDIHKEGILTTYFHAVNNLLETSATDDAIANDEADIVN